MQSSLFDLLYSIAFYLMVSLGYWKIFEKCGVRQRWAFIPILREYHIGICANMEKEGRTYAVISAILYVLEVLYYIVIEKKNLIVLVSIVILALSIANIIYLVRIYLGLIKVFNRKRRWVCCFILFEGVTALVWGFSPKFMPVCKVERADEAEGAKVAGIKADITEQGLTINIQDRTVIDFFQKKYLLKDIHMNIPRGHMVLLLGGSGAGKTTFVNAVTGYEKANATIELDGSDLYTEYENLKYDVGFVPQQDLMRGNDTVQLTLSDAAALRLPSSITAAERHKRIAKVLEQFGLTAVKDKLVEKLSGGQRKRLSIAMEFISDPSLFILDEPDSGLDGVVARQLFESLRAIADQGKIVVVITHTPDRVIDLFDDVIVLAKDATRTGRLAWYGSVDEAYSFFGKESMEDILLSVNQKDEGGEGRANEFVEKYADHMRVKAG